MTRINCLLVYFSNVLISVALTKTVEENCPKGLAQNVYVPPSRKNWKPTLKYLGVLSLGFWPEKGNYKYLGILS